MQYQRPKETCAEKTVVLPLGALELIDGIDAPVAVTDDGDQVAIHHVSGPQEGPETWQLVYRSRPTDMPINLYFSDYGAGRVAVRGSHAFARNAVSLYCGNKWHGR